MTSIAPRRLHADAVVADTHNDLLGAVGRRQRRGRGREPAHPRRCRRGGADGAAGHDLRRQPSRRGRVEHVLEVIEDTTPPCCEDLTGGDPLARQLAYVPGMEGPRGLPIVTEALVRRAWPEADVRAVLGENVPRLFRAGWGRPS